MRAVLPAITILLSLLSSAAGAGTAFHRVLLIHSFSRDFAPFSSVANGFRSELAARNPVKVEFVEISLQTLQEEAAERQAAALADFVAASFPDRAPDLVVAIGFPAANFYVARCAGRLGSSPLLIAGADRRRLGALPQGIPVVSASLELDLGSLLADMRLAVPGLRRICYVSGVTPLERFWEEEAIRA